MNVKRLALLCVGSGMHPRAGRGANATRLFSMKTYDSWKKSNLGPTVASHSRQSCKVIVHALDEKARAYYNLEGLWTPGTIQNERDEDLQKALVKVRRKNNSKKPAKKNA
ncbi:hypothetical protein VNO78_28467 [Psophocarpus tetragonolobus]|uniref:Uncharacterized protein n=1 Tax=Psophocarpus tetragonolobus TaxID=3891 RepID=A0AAN9XDB5_PSOTE